MTMKAYVGCWAAVGLIIGACLGGGLLFLGQDSFGSEAMEGAVILGMIVSLPLSAVLGFCFDWGGYANQWTMFLAIVPAANGTLLGALIGYIILVIQRLLQRRGTAKGTEEETSLIFNERMGEMTIPND
jgi:predicted membrane protein